MTLKELTILISENKPLPSLTDEQQKKVKAKFDERGAMVAYGLYLDYVQPKIKRTLL